jgi:hypothetical protein
MRVRLLASIVLGVAVTACSAAPGTTAPTPAGPQNGPMDVHRSVAAAAPSDPDGQRVTAWQDSGEAEGASGPKGPPAAVVPNVEGLVFASAVHRLWQAGIDVQLVIARASHAPRYSVIEQDPGAGSLTPADGVVNLVLSLHRVGGPGVLGTVACKPELEDLDDPYCLGKLLKY